MLYSLSGLLGEDFITPFAAALVEMLGLRADKKSGYYSTGWGKKTAEGLARSVVTLMEDVVGKAANPVGNHPIVLSLDNDRKHLEQMASYVRNSMVDTLPLLIRDYCMVQEINYTSDQKSVLFWLAVADYFRRKFS